MLAHALALWSQPLVGGFPYGFKVVCRKREVVISVALVSDGEPVADGGVHDVLVECCADGVPCGVVVVARHVQLYRQCAASIDNSVHIAARHTVRRQLCNNALAYTLC